MNYELYHRIHFCFNQLKMNKEQIARELEMSPTTVRKWLKIENYGQRTYAKRASKVDLFKSRINELLQQSPEFSAMQIYTLIKSEGFEGGRSIIASYVASVRPKTKKAFLTLNFDPGESAQVDWGVAGYIELEGRRRKVSYFVMVLCYSRMLFVKFCLTEAQEAWSECHREAFEYFGGVPKKVMVDNCKTAVISHKSGEAVIFNNAYVDLANHYGFKIVACNVRQPQEKGRVENGVGYVRKSFINGRKLDPFELLNLEIATWLDEVANVRLHGTTKQKPREMWKKEILQSLPIHPYDCVVRTTVKINKMYRVRFASNTYSVPAEYVYENAILEVSTLTIHIWSKGRLIAEHQRCFSSNKDINNIQHDNALIQNRKRAEEKKITAWLLRVSHKAEEFHQKMSTRTLSLSKELRQLYALGQIYDHNQIAQAIEDALIFDACNAAYVRNILEQKELDQVGPLHISHKSDALEITLDTPNINIYEGR